MKPAKRLTLDIGACSLVLKKSFKMDRMAMVLGNVEGK